MKVNYVKLAAVACLSSSVMASPTAMPSSEGSLVARSWDTQGWWNSWWGWVRDSSEDGGRGHNGKKCKKPVVRKEWRKYTIPERKKYIEAVKCLAKKPSRSAEMAGAISRFDDFQGVHCAQTDTIHWVGHFIIWHRLFLARYETALRDECGWTGGLPYWDWLIDTDSNVTMTEWEIFNPEHGMGGNGPFIETDNVTNPFGITDRSGGGCVLDGPFTEDKFSIGLGPGLNLSTSNPHCLIRDFCPDIIGSNSVRWVWNEVLEQSDFGRFAKRLEAVPSFDVKNVHGGTHFGVGGALGTLGNAYNSPGDPIFYFHHGNLDRLFWMWQLRDITTRLRDVSGPSVKLDYANALGPNVTLDFEINLGEFTDNIKLRDLMNVEGGELCYTYE